MWEVMIMFDNLGNLISFVCDSLGKQDVIVDYNQSNKGKVHTFNFGSRSKEGFAEVKPFYFFSQIMKFIKEGQNKQCETDFTFLAQEERLVSGWITVKFKDSSLRINFTENFKGKG